MPPSVHKEAFWDKKSPRFLENNFQMQDMGKKAAKSGERTGKKWEKCRPCMKGCRGGMKK